MMNHNKINMNNRTKGVLLAMVILIAGMGQGRAQHMRGRPNTYSDEGRNDGMETGFKKENLFVGGGLSLGFGSYNFNIGATPEIGYSLNKWLDAGLALNINYNSIRADPNLYYNDNTRYRSFNYGAGIFARAWPVNFIFLQVQPEFNFIDYNEKYIPTGQTYTAHTNAGSLLAGLGYGQRIIGESSFFVSVSIDLLNSSYSPYRDQNGVMLPVIRGGFDIYLHKRK